MLTGKTNEERIWNYLTAHGLNDYGAAGVMANLWFESGYQPDNLQNGFERALGFTDSDYTAAVDNGRYQDFIRDSAGYGLCQWTYWARKQALLEFAKTRGASIGDLEMQLDFMLSELEKYGALWLILHNATSVRQAADKFMMDFERPLDMSEAARNMRAEYGKALYNKYARKVTNVSTVRIGHARSSENNAIPGDTNGREVAVTPWNDGGWDFMALHPDPLIREKHAATAEAICANDNVGYSQVRRNTLYQALQEVGFDPARISKRVDCDCSSFQNVCAVLSGSGATYGANGWVTWNMREALEKLGFKILDKGQYGKYLKSADYAVRGAIYCREPSDTGHTMCALDNGSRAAETLAAMNLSNGKADSSISVGDKNIQTASGAAGASAPGCTRTYKVKYGDTLGQIAINTLGSYSRMNEIAELNGIKDKNKIQEGSILILPEK